MALNKCKTCVYYKQNKKMYSYDNDARKSWESLNMGECKSDKMMNQEDITDETNLSDKLVYWDYEGYGAGVEVGEEFGCIHHEPKA